MPLIIYGKPLGAALPRPLKELWEFFPPLKEASMKLRDIPVKLLDPKGLLYVGQKEYAGTSPIDNSISYLGTDSATTCHIAVLRETGSGATCIGHFDGSATYKGVHGMLKNIMDIAGSVTGRFELTLAGGFNDERRISSQISDELLYEFNSHPQDVHLMCATISDMNTVMKEGTPFPVIYGLGVDMKHREIFPATFVDRGPDYPLRNAMRMFDWQDSFPCIYNFHLRRIVIQPFNYCVDDVSCVDKFINLTDKEILMKFSTSPKQEPPNFVEDFRNTFIHIRIHPTPMRSLFKNGLPRYYKQSPEGLWVDSGHSYR
uniref:Protein N-terminal asparagine amidohydrolase n=1 Tax=Octopus bimaculoides TaxID=37653 RepID=A0A0L8G4E6_OCTBM